MSIGYMSLFDMAIVGVPAMIIGVWQLVSVSREIRRDKQAAADAQDSPDSARHSVGEHRLDDR